MRLLNLTVENFGLFRGLHSFDLAAHDGFKGARNVVLFSGHNGAGKSTLFRALTLGLYGRSALGERTTQAQYHAYLQSRLHRRSAGDKTEITPSARIRVSLKYVVSGRTHVISIERGWTAGRTTQEVLNVESTDTDLPKDQEGFQDWLDGRLPPEQAALCFYDAEDLDSLSNPEQHGRAFAELIRRILGLDLVERLHSDLDQYLTRSGASARPGKLQSVLAHLQSEVDVLTGQVEDATQAALAMDERELTLRSDLATQERLLSSEGGHYAKQRPVLQDRLAVVRTEVARLSAMLREEAAQLLPFALCPTLCASLQDRMTREAELQRARMAENLLSDRIQALAESFGSPEFWRDVEITDTDRFLIARRVVDVLSAETRADVAIGPTILSHLSEAERGNILGWVEQATRHVPARVGDLGEQLRALLDEQRRIAEDLERAPADETVARIHAEIQRLETELAGLQREQAVLRERLGRMRFQLEETDRKREKMVDEVVAAGHASRRLDLAQRSRSVLRAYQDALTRRRIEALEEAVVGRFNAICQKDNLLEALSIRPDTFEVELRRMDGHVVSLADFSAGERQLYSLALLWALRKVSGQALPLAVDTPVARLDDEHRARFLHDYVPEVSSQVLLFVTTAEMDAGLLGQMEPYVLRTYRLAFDEGSQATVVHCQEHGTSAERPATAMA